MPGSLASDPPFGNLSNKMGKLADQLQKTYYNYRCDQAWRPAVNLYETKSAYLVCVDLAGGCFARGADGIRQILQEKSAQTSATAQAQRNFGQDFFA